MWHFIRRLASGCTSEYHPLYGIFEWDADDFNALIRAKRGELVQAGITSPSVKIAGTKDKMAKHCRRRTRGADQTTDLIEELLLSLSTAPWRACVSGGHQEYLAGTEVTCLQDPPSVLLYAIKSHLMKGGVQLPVFRCARGTTSLESFHLHLNQFIPGNIANGVHFQAYLLDSITRWNAD